MRGKSVRADPCVLSLLHLRDKTKYQQGHERRCPNSPVSRCVCVCVCVAALTWTLYVSCPQEHGRLCGDV